MDNLLYREETHRIIGALMEVHATLGCGFFEPVYQEAIALEFESRGIPFEAEKKLTIRYKDVILQKYYIADFICFDSIIVEVKALTALTSDHEAQVLNYLKATGLRVGLLVNFGEKSLRYKRFIR